ncbi:MBL fold metallo-hydrolase [Bariatricus sp. SGI.154]|uniref:MBL fold metallo-hydrolase n=1 Tax=Bariatricus sp. SGI.154 TaxID=3420549 RepID=UPI003CFE63D4
MRIVNLIENTPGKPHCQYEHGLSFYIETEKHKLLMDSGASDMFLYNAKVLGVDLTQVDTMILSHGHYDHAGGILAFAKLNPGAKIYLKSSAGLDYYHLTGEEEKYIGIDKDILQLEQCVTVDSDLRLDDELFLYTDIIGSRYPAKGNLQLKKKVDGVFVQDTFDHEQCLVVTQGDKRILLSGCAHNGILNILDKYAEIFHSEPDIVISGFHLMQKEGYTEEDIANIQKIADALMETRSIFYTGHCTGQIAYEIMKEIMGDRLHPIHSGETLI